MTNDRQRNWSIWVAATFDLDSGLDTLRGGEDARWILDVDGLGVRSFVWQEARGSRRRDAECFTVGVVLSISGESIQPASRMIIRVPRARKAWRESSSSSSRWGLSHSCRCCGPRYFSHRRRHTHSIHSIEVLLAAGSDLRHCLHCDRIKVCSSRIRWQYCNNCVYIVPNPDRLRRNGCRHNEFCGGFLAGKNWFLLFIHVCGWNRNRVLCASMHIMYFNLVVSDADFDVFLRCVCWSTKCTKRDKQKWSICVMVS